jgi:hypothetical protein
MKHLLRSLFPFALALLASCGGGGGVDTGGTGGAVPAGAAGPIAGFGSVFVGGVRFDDSAAEVEDFDGNRRSRDDLRLGMTVEIESGAVADVAGQPAASARRIRVESELAGFVAAVDLAGETFTVLGQRVAVDAATVFDERLAGPWARPWRSTPSSTRSGSATAPRASSRPSRAAGCCGCAARWPR